MVTGGGSSGQEDDDDDDVMKPTVADGMTTPTVVAGGEPAAVPKAEADADNGADDRAATTIQAVYRGFRARKYFEAVNAAAIKIQAGFRGYRVRQSLKNGAPSTTTDESQCWSDDDQKSVVSVTYVPLKDAAADGDAGDAAEPAQPPVDDDDQLLQTGDDEVFEYDDDPAKTLGSSQTPQTLPVQVDAADVDAEAMTNAAVKIQAQVRGMATRKRLNDAKNSDGSENE